MPSARAVAVTRNASRKPSADEVCKPARASASFRAKSELPALAPAERQRYIAEAAYYRSQERDFAGDGALSDWLAAEAEIEARYPV